MFYSQSCSCPWNHGSPPLLWHLKHRSYLRVGCLFSKNKPLGQVLCVQALRGGAGCAGAPSQSLSYLFWQSISGMRPCLVGIFSSFDSLGPTKIHSFVSPYITPWESSGLFLSGIHRSNIVCSQQSVNFLEQQRDIGFAPFEFLLCWLSHSPYQVPRE